MSDRRNASSPRGVRQSGVGRAYRVATNMANFRQRLFQGQLTRRSTTNSSSESQQTRLDGAGGDDDAPATLDEPPDSTASSDIVVRDQNGEIEVDELPPPLIDEEDEMALDAQQESEKERQRLSEAVKQHQIDQNSMPAQPEELLEAVRASLRAKMAALDEDNWMYEREDFPRRD